MTAEILETEKKVFYILFLFHSYKMRSFLLLLFMIKLYSQINISNDKANICCNEMYSKLKIKHALRDPAFY